MAASCIVAETPFPIYGISAVGDRHFLLAGGGGAAKTGVPNEIFVFYMDVDENGQFRALKTLSLETGSLATMNLDVFRKGDEFLLATGQDRFCKMYALKYGVTNFLNGHVNEIQLSSAPVSSSHGQPHQPVRRRTSSIRASVSDHGPVEVTRKALMEESGDAFTCLTFEADEIRSFQSDSHPKLPLQKVVRFSPDGKTLATGGCDGHFRLWNVETGKKLMDHNAHKDDVDDIAFSPDGKYILTVGRDSKSYAWTVADASKYSEVKLPETADKVRYRTAKFAKFGKSAPIFFTAANPVSRGGGNHRSLVTQWALLPKECHSIASEVLRKEEVSSMAVDQSGTLLALGTMTGSVHIWNGIELRPLAKFFETHPIFVTGLQFLPPPSESLTKLSCFYLKHRCGVISIGADKTARLNVVPKKRSASLMLKLSISCFLIFLISYLIGLS